MKKRQAGISFGERIFSLRVSSVEEGKTERWRCKKLYRAGASSPLAAPLALAKVKVAAF